MRVCLDVRSRSGGGLPVYIRNLVPRLREARPGFEFVLAGHPDQPLVDGAAESLVLPEVGRAGELLWVQARLPRLLRRRGIDVYHALKHPGPLACPCPDVLSLHEVGQYLRRRTLPWIEHAYWRWFQPLALRRADHVIANSRWTREVLTARLGVPEEKTSAVPYGVDPVFHRARSGELPPAPDGVPTEYVLAVGNINPKKNLGVVVDAMRILRDRGRPTPPLVIAGGEGYRADAFFEHVEAARLEDRVTTTGFVGHGTLAGLYRRAEFLVYPSLYEAFGLPPVEAMAAGCRVVASDRGAIRRVTGGHALYIDDPRDPERVAAAMAAALEEPEPAREARRAEAAEWAGRYRWEAAAEATASVYERLAGADAAGL